MTKTNKKRTSTKIIAMALFTIMLLSSVLSINASAMENFHQGSYIFASVDGRLPDFSTGSNTLLTVSANATAIYGNPTSVTLTLQKNGLFGWTNVRTDTVWVGNPTTNLYTGLKVSPNTTYRICYRLNGTEGIDTADLSLGLVLYS